MHVFAYVSMCFKLSIVFIWTNNLFIKQTNWLNVILPCFDLWNYARWRMINMAKWGRYSYTAVVIAVLLYQALTRSTAGKAWRAHHRQVSLPKARLAASSEGFAEDALRERKCFWGGGFAYVKWTTFYCAWIVEYISRTQLISCFKTI